MSRESLTPIERLQADEEQERLRELRAIWKRQEGQRRRRRVKNLVAASVSVIFLLLALLGWFLGYRP